MDAAPVGATDSAVILADGLVYPMPKRDDLNRLSIGCEDTDDLLPAFAQALDAL